MKFNLSQAEENYLKAIYSIGIDTGKSVNTNQIALKMKTKASSVTDMVKKLSDKGLVEHKKYKGALVTSKGESIAVSTLRSHRLWECFLVDTLEFNWDEVHDIAEQLEHIKSDSLVDRLDKFLNFPSYDPHGDPIPDKNGVIEHHKNVMLSSVDPEASCIVIGVKDSSSSFLKFLDNAGICLGKKIKVLTVEDFDQSMQLEIESKVITVSHQISKNLYVKK
ncbi:MAG: iron-dependent repressor [Flavobacteriaceae bacterium]|nr:MAG: iron-dependent repressor [Flavobacteriaceae bacterium]